MKMRRKCIALLLVVVLILFISGCSEDGETAASDELPSEMIPTASDKATGEETSKSPTEELSIEPTSEPMPSEDPFSNGPSLETIQEDIEKESGFAELAVDTTGFSVIKRQTTVEDKEDLVWITICGENDEYTVVRHYKAEYVLYNDGWLLENVYSYQDDDHYNVTTPLRLPEQSYIDATIEQIDPTEYASFDAEYIHDYSIVSIEQVSSDLSENFGAVVYEMNLFFQYECFNEYVTLPIRFSFGVVAGNDVWGWISEYSNYNLSRTVELNEGIVGTWNGLDYSGSIYQVYGPIVTISDYTSNGCDIEQYESRYSTGTYFSSGHMRIDQIYDNDDGTILSVWLSWDDGEDHGYCSSSLSLTDYYMGFLGDEYCLSSAFGARNKELYKQ